MEYLTVWIRIGLYIVAGYLYGSGWISDEIRQTLTSDPEVLVSLELAIVGLITSVPILWWKLAQKFNWAT